MKKFFNKRILCFILVVCSLFTLAALPASAASYSYGSTVKIVKFDAVAGGKITQNYATFSLKGALWKKSVKIVALGGAATCNPINSGARFDVKVHDSNGKLISEYRNLKIGSTFTIPGAFKTSTVYVCSKFPGYNINSFSHNAAALRGTYTLR